ncbi:MAG TPA: hypothetical protein PKM88_04245 [bacterium]|nr:hypothetical protein [bacterium]
MKIIMLAGLAVVLAVCGCQPAAVAPPPATADTAAVPVPTVALTVPALPPAATTPAAAAPAPVAGTADPAAHAVPPAVPEAATASVPAVAAASVDDRTTDTGKARTAMQQYRGGYAHDGNFRVENVQVRGARAVGTWLALTPRGVVDASRPVRTFVAVKANGRWTVYALGADIIDPWAEPVSRIFGDA